MGNKQKFLMLITDCPDEQVLIMRALCQGGVQHEVVVVRDVTEATEFLEGCGRYADRNIGRRPSFILIDLKSPHVGGYMTLQRLRGHPKSRLIPITILTSSCQESDLCRGSVSGANSLVLKPMDAGKLAETLGRVVRYWLYINETAP